MPFLPKMDIYANWAIADNGSVAESAGGINADSLMTVGFDYHYHASCMEEFKCMSKV